MLLKVTKIIVIVALVALSLYDLVVFLIGGEQVTISFVIWEWSKEAPIIPFGFGVLMGHFFWQSNTKTE